VRAGAHYRMDEGEIEIESVEPIDLAEVTPQLARESGFAGVADLLQVARHGRGDNIYLIRFRYLHSLPAPPAPRENAGERKRASKPGKVTETALARRRL